MKTFYFTFLAFLVVTSGLAQSTLNCDFTVSAKACVNQQVYITYTGGASANATYTWNFDGGVVIMGTGQGPYKVKWETPGEKHVTLTINFEGLTCTASRPVVVIEQPQLFHMTGGGTVIPGGPGVNVGLSGSETGIIYKLRRGSEYTGTYVLGTGSAISFGAQTIAGNYNAVAKVDGSDCMREMEGTAVVTTSAPPVSIPICMVTFDTTLSMSKITWNKPAELHMHHVNIYRETYQTNHFEKIGETPWSAPGFYLDQTSNPLIKPDKFKISVTDSSGNESEKSAWHKTIHLNVNPGVLGFNLIWNHYEGFEFYTYKIHRRHETGPWTVIDSIAGNIDSYTDFYTVSGLMYYYIEVVKPVPCNGQFKSNSEELLISNVASSRPLGTAELSRSGVKIYPNPVKEVLFVGLQGTSVSVVELLQPDGRCVVKTEIHSGSSIIPVSGLSSGLYLVKISGPDGVFVGRIIKY